MPDLTTVLLDRLERLEKQLAELRRGDRAPNKLLIRNGVNMPNVAAAVGQIYIAADEGTVRIRFPDGAVREFTTTEVVVAVPSLDFADGDMSMYLGAI